MISKLIGQVTSLLTPIALLAAWWILSAGSTSPYFLPLSDIIDGFQQTWTTERIVDDVLPTVRALLIGFAAAVVTGLAGGVALGLSARTRRDLRPITEFLRSMPVVALVPIGLVVLGPGQRMEAALVAFAATWPILVSASDGVRAADLVMIDTARVYGVPAWRRLLRVTIPAAMPQVIAGVRIAVAAAVGTVIVANMLASSSGLGYVVISAQQSFDIRETWAGLLMIGLVGSVLTCTVVLAERVLLGWHRRYRSQGRTAP